MVKVWVAGEITILNPADVVHDLTTITTCQMEFQFLHIDEN